MSSLAEAFGVALASAAIAAGMFIAWALAWRCWRWKAYAAAYLASRALAHHAERFHLWACRLPKEPPPEGMGGLYMGPIKMADTKVIFPGRDPIEQLLHEAGLEQEVDDPND